MNIGILGSGMIVNGALYTMMSMQDVKCTALYVRESSREKGEKLQSQFHFDTLYTDMEKFFADESFDMVYVGVINSLHYDYVKRSLEHGKHVICEKPFTSTAAEARELRDLAKAKGLMLFEAIMLRYSANYDSIRTHLTDLGDIRMVQCNYGQYSSRYDKYLAGEVLPAFDPKYSGGALYDINIYCIHFTIGLFGKPESAVYYPNIGFNGIDTSGVMILDYGTFKAVCMGAKDSNSQSFISIQGEKGYINMMNIPSAMTDIKLIRNKQEPEVIDVESVKNPMQKEFERINELYLAKDYDTVNAYLDASVTVMEVVEEARKNAGIMFACDENA